MPILDREPFLHPADLLTRSLARLGLPEDGPPWWAAHTLSRHEKSLMRKLSRRNIGFYCPIAPHRYRSPAGRSRISHLPLFSNYVFFEGDEMTRHAVMTTGCVARCIRAPDPRRLVGQLRAIQAAIEADIPLTAESRIPVGTPVRVRSGPFEGVEGILVERRQQCRVYLQVDFIQQGASLQAFDWELERL